MYFKEIHKPPSVWGDNGNLIDYAGPIHQPRHSWSKSQYSFCKDIDFLKDIWSSGPSIFNGIFYNFLLLDFLRSTPITITTHMPN